MKTAALLVVTRILSASRLLLSGLLLSGLFLSSALAQVPPPGNALPPPDIRDPGTTAVPAAAPTAAPALPAMHDAGEPRDARGEPPPEVSVQQRGDDSVQEYRRNGRVYMVVVTPKNGVAQTYMVDPQGRVVDEHGKKPVGTVMYKILEWGKPLPPAAAASSAQPDGADH